MRKPVVRFCEVEKAYVDVFDILPRFFENVVCSATARTKAALGIIQFWFNYFMSSFQGLEIHYSRKFEEIDVLVVGAFLLSPVLCTGIINPV